MQSLYVPQLRLPSHTFPALGNDSAWALLAENQQKGSAHVQRIHHEGADKATQAMSNTPQDVLFGFSWFMAATRIQPFLPALSSVASTVSVSFFHSRPSFQPLHLLENLVKNSTYSILILNQGMTKYEQFMVRKLRWPQFKSPLHRASAM